MDEIALVGLRAFAHHGVFEHERENGQEFIVDVRVMLDLSAAAGSDELAKTIHYGELAEQVVAAVESSPVDLIETVAQRVVDIVFTFDAARWARVTVHKPNAPITVPFADVSVTLNRKRPE
ncbi:MAG: folB [Microbacteriaceae bacterium]|nr:folB [Microbacteriaceae bacterium]